MIKLSSKTYTIKNISVDLFWANLDDITCGQNINPEISYTTPFWGDFDNVFAGRKVGETFSVYLYRPIYYGFRTEILAKGKVLKVVNDLKIGVTYEIPVWSTLIFLAFTGLLILMLAGNGIALTISAVTVIIALYSLIIHSNHNDIRREIARQFKALENR